MRVLSIDWDFLIGAAGPMREDLFPQDNEYSDEHTQQKNWTKLYYDLNTSRILRGIQPCLLMYTKFYSAIMGYDYTKGVLVVSKSHADIYEEIIQYTRFTEPDKIEVYNLDFHHDMYHLTASGDEVNCGNWARKLEEHFKDSPIEFEYKWIGWETSDRKTITGDIISMYPFALAQDKLEEIKSFDMVFLCRSDPWSPPHLDHYFNLPLINSGKSHLCIPERIYPRYENKTFNINPGDLFRHFKGSIIEVIELCYHSETEAPMVCYRHLDDRRVWVRPLEMFCQSIVREGKEVPRFTKL